MRTLRSTRKFHADCVEEPSVARRRAGVQGGKEKWVMAWPRLDASTAQKMQPHQKAWSSYDLDVGTRKGH